MNDNGQITWLWSMLGAAEKSSPCLGLPRPPNWGLLLQMALGSQAILSPAYVFHLPSGPCAACGGWPVVSGLVFKPVCSILPSLTNAGGGACIHLAQIMHTRAHRWPCTHNACAPTPMHAHAHMHARAPAGWRSGG